MPLPPTLTVTIEHIGTDAGGGAQYLAKVLRANDAEICRHTFTFRDDTLVDIEPQWMLEKAVPRHVGEWVKRGPADAARTDTEVGKLAAYGQRLYGFLFGDGRELEAFFKYNDAYRDRAQLTLALHANAAALWKLPWEYLHDGRDFLALHGRFLLHRMPYGLGQLQPDAAPLPLRVLVVIAAPDDLNPLDTEEEIGVIQEALDEAVRTGRVQVHYLDDATLPAIGDALRDFKPHVLHYTGHGVYDKAQERSFLALEREDGRAQLAGIADLRPHLKDDPDLRLVLLSACQSGQTSGVDAFSGVATGMLDAGIPAVLAMQFSILDNSAICLARAFYAALADGSTPAEAIQRARVALWQFEEGPGFDWGIPALYLRAQGMRLVDAGATTAVEATGAAALYDVGGLPLPPHFVGRKPELRELRRALRDPAINAAFVRGIGGMGKSSLAAKLIQRPGADLDGVCVIRCHEVDALDVPKKLADFLAAQGKAGHAAAAALLLDSRLDPAARARAAAAKVADRRYVIVFDNFESLQEAGSKMQDAGGKMQDAGSKMQDAGGKIQDTDIEHPASSIEHPASSFEHPASGNETTLALLRGLLDARWRSTCVFTGRLRWEGLDAALGRGTAVELHLPSLTARQAIMLMDNLPRLRREPVKTKIALYKKVGGHPKSIELLNGWLTSGRVTDLLTDPALDGMLQAQWEDYFLRALLARLTPAARRALARLSIFRTPLDDEEFDYAGVNRETVARWLDLSLVQRERAAPGGPPEMAALPDMLPPAEREKLQARETYTVHPVVREYLLAQEPPDALRDLHLWAAAYYGTPFVDAARNHLRQHPDYKTIQPPDDETNELARNDVVEYFVSQTQDMPQARAAMARALAWQHHLFQAGAYDPAGEIVIAVIPTLARWGERDRAKGLLRSSIATREGFAKAVAQGNLATLLVNEGKLDEALATYEAVYKEFERANSKQQMATVLTQIASIYQIKGDYDKAIAYEERSLALGKERGNEEGQAVSLHQLAMLYHLKGDLPAALERSQAAEQLDRKRGDQAGLAADLHEQGIIFTLMTPEEVGEIRRTSNTLRVSETLRVSGAPEDTEPTPTALAAARFQESLAIKRRIGNEGGAASSLGELGKLLMDAGRYQEAIAAFNETLEIDQRSGNPVEIAIDLEFLGSVHERQGQYAAALEKFREALGLFQKYSSPQEVARTERNIAIVEKLMRET